MHYFLIVALQAFCIYHAYKNKNDYYWYYLILFLPLIGGVIYIFTQVLNQKDVSVVQNEIVKVINPTKKVNDLRKKVEFADTFQNRVDLGNALFEIGDYSSGIVEFETILDGNYTKDTGVTKKLIEGYFKTENFDKTIFCAGKIKNLNDFKGSRSQFLYGLALEQNNKLEEAEENLVPIDQRYSNYEERFELAHFFIRRNKEALAEELLAEIITESNYMSKPNKRKYRHLIIEVKKLHSSITA